MSAVQRSNSDSEMSAQLTPDLCGCSALPASIEPLHGYVVSPDSVQDAGGAAVIEKRLDCADAINSDCSANTQASGLTESVLTTETVALQCQNVARSKVSCFILFVSVFLHILADM